MEVKIKNNNEMIDATIEMVDGIMVVSPKEVKFAPKDGDVVVSDYGSDEIQIFICKESLGGSIYSYCMYDIEDNSLTFHENIRYIVDRPATEEEKKKLFDRMKEEGYEFDFEKKEFVKLKWKPKYKEPYFAPHFSKLNFIFSTCSHIYTKHFTDDLTFKKTSVFKTEQECQEFCNRLNEAINSVKP